MRMDKRAKLIGDGIIDFCFKLLPNVKDQNYPKPEEPSDIGERHVFECTCVGGTVWQLHYHKNGKHDEPNRIPYRSSIWHLANVPAWAFDEPITASMGLPASTWPRANVTASEKTIMFSREAIFDPRPEHNTPLGSPELVTALSTICSDKRVYDITNMRAVHWHRWLQTLCRRTAIDYVGPGIARIYAYNEIEKATIMFAHPDNTSTLVEHTHSHGKSKKTQRRHVEIPNTQAHLEGWTVVMTDTSWLRIKADS